MEKFCLQCGAPLILKSVAADPVYPYGPQVSACSSCNSRSYAVSGNKIKELTAQRDELLVALKALYYGCVKPEMFHLGAATPPDEIIVMVEKALENA